ncbi:retron system putative HNH endonuclease [Oceanimonas smirnovii]|uniref:retron system putative HNH endonuclease n=1 Tax=Oceanimonas smirnovii TaxID=264574 RepID=UPI000378DC38|nr:retron system putative HNH endonuclease [Oceanimonas smirnovii]
MKKVLKGKEPDQLKRYRADFPDHNWKQCTQGGSTKTRKQEIRVRRQQIQQQLREDQGGLCAYCEIDLRPAASDGVADLRVEHFHPKSDNSTDHNWHLDWQNLLACCHGGSRPDVVEAGVRYSSPDHSCDVPKAEQNWDNLILNPLQLPASPCLFKYQRANGAILVNIEHCQQAGIEQARAQATIENLRLDADRLRRLRKGELDRINELLRNLVQQGKSVEAARSHLARALLRKDSEQQWPRFFSAIRSYLGRAAEEQLTAINYDG